MNLIWFQIQFSQGSQVDKGVVTKDSFLFFTSSDAIEGQIQAWQVAQSVERFLRKKGHSIVRQVKSLEVVLQGIESKRMKSFWYQLIPTDV